MTHNTHSHQLLIWARRAEHKSAALDTLTLSRGLYHQEAELWIISPAGRTAEQPASATAPAEEKRCRYRASVTEIKATARARDTSHSFLRYRSESQAGGGRDTKQGGGGGCGAGRRRAGLPSRQGLPRAVWQDSARWAGVGDPHVGDAARRGAARPGASTFPLPGHNTGRPGHPRVSLLSVWGVFKNSNPMQRDEVCVFMCVQVRGEGEGGVGRHQEDAG